MRLDIDSECKTTLKHLRNPFPAIYHHFGRYIDNQILDPNHDFCDFHVFLTSHNISTPKTFILNRGYFLDIFGMLHLSHTNAFTV